MIKNKISVLLVIALVLMQIVPAHAATATGSNAIVATSSDADQILSESDEFGEKLDTQSC
ncbi:MAG: hypothetical protein ACI39W_02565 [Brotaphodocola sp.]